MLKKIFAFAVLATALFASPVVTNEIVPIPNCLPCKVEIR